MKSRILGALLLTCATGLACSPSHAAGRLAEVAIIDRDSGSRLEAHYFRGEYWVAGVPGARYSIELRNHLDERILTVTSVDGVNIVSGESADWGQSGYVLDPGQHYEIAGWRKSDSEIAAFSFTAPANSYAERTGRPGNIGVIGVAVFRERPSAADRPILASKADAAPALPAAPAAQDRLGAGSPVAGEARGMLQNAPRAELASASRARAPALGTGHGERETSFVEHTEFVRRQAQPNEIIRIRYDSLENLVALGVIARPRPYPTHPNPFPGSGPAQYVPDPPPG